MLLNQNAAISLSDFWLVFLNFLNIFFCLLNISYYNFNFSYQIVKSSRTRWAGHVARMGERRGLHRVLVGKPEGNSHWGDPDVDGSIILRWIFR